MSHQDSPLCTMYDRQDDYDLDEDNEEYMEEDRDVEDPDDSDEDTEEASETDMGKSEEYTEIKEQMYQDKLAGLKKQLQQLNDGTHPDYNRKLKRLETQYRERLSLNIIYRDYLTECVERDYILEKKAAVKEFEEKKIDLKENLLTDMEEKRKIIESDRHTMELAGDSMEVKPVMTRKLRRRPNDPVPEKVEKRRKPAPASLNYLLDEKEIESDLKTISRGKVLTTVRKPVVLPHYNAVNIPSQHISQSSETPLVETRIEDGKLLYERRWYHRGQPVYVEGKDLAKFAAHISAIGTEAIWVKKVSDSSKVRIYTSQLSRGKISIKRRAS
ncbi:sin3 histone deacetylase corepressor complex component SDS3 isoform X2 [Harpegnathos saltator]|uniref:Sin3 histone deacetylase corepressor complex component SDS3 n=1 Tax=Harpegnathos saltator TaxID=610380 RepID=E2BWV9_HARSA|nr:sin3 histone deacetylase corepressor complex component SDS3 isoform X2 [Harpegnathos saltator]EFN79823.1 Sin3 histone deacetylase corepressor complex component SDS3 [Harpegnathos saltator]